MKKYLIQVVPIIPLPVLGTQVFSYWHPEPLPVGTLVTAPFYFREIKGVVVGSKKNSLPKSSLKLKNINSVVEMKYISENQVGLAQKIAEYYFAPLGSVLKLMIPTEAGQRKEIKKSARKTGIIGKMDETAREIMSSKRNKFLLYGHSKQRQKINSDLIRQCIKKNKQCLILVPEIFFSRGVHEKMQLEFSEEIALIHSRITKGKYYAFWKEIKAGKIKIVIASKIGIFLPFTRLGLIIIQEEQDVSFKQWESMPRYSAVRGAEFLADLSGAKLMLESVAPSSETLYRAKKGELMAVALDKVSKKFPKFEIITLEGKKKNPDFPISNALYGRLAKIVIKNKQAVIFVNRRGFSTRTICENCKKALKCPKCKVALVYSEEHGNYNCLHCKFKMDILSACPSCGGFQFSHRGIGTQTVESKLKRLFPTANIARLDADTIRSAEKSQIIMQKFSAGEINILVCTQSAIKGIYSDNIELAASISGRDFIDGVEFNSRELVISRLFHMANLINKNGALLIQSFFGGNPLFERLKDTDLNKYFAQELSVRRKFAYPPFRKFVKLICRDKSEKKARMESQKTFDLLQSTGNNMIEIIGPYKPLSAWKRGLFQRNILIKMEPKMNIQDLPIRSVIGSLRKGWSVDVDPVSLF